MAVSENLSSPLVAPRSETLATEISSMMSRDRRRGRDDGARERRVADRSVADRQPLGDLVAARGDPLGDREQHPVARTTSRSWAK